MPKSEEVSGSDSGSASDAEEEEYVVEKVVDKRTTKSGKVCKLKKHTTTKTFGVKFDFLRFFALRLNTS